MSGTDRLLLSLLVKVALLDKKGAEFERFFTAAAIEMWGDDFEPWKPQGRYGDYKCDGYRRSTRTVFQCNAPEQFVARDVEGKIEKDFEGARAHFGNRMKVWIFVHNQKETDRVPWGGVAAGVWSPCSPASAGLISVPRLAS